MVENYLKNKGTKELTKAEKVFHEFGKPTLEVFYRLSSGETLSDIGYTGELFEITGYSPIDPEQDFLDITVQ